MGDRTGDRAGAGRREDDLAPVRSGNAGSAHATLTAARPDGNVIEGDIRLAADAPRALPNDAFRRMFVAASCKQSLTADFIGKGGGVRYAMITAEGRGIDRVTIDSCSAD